MLSAYRFDHPTTNESKVLDAQSYLRASLFGPLYVLYQGFPLLAFLMALLMIPISAAIAIVGFFSFGLLDWVLNSGLIGMLTLLVAAIAMLVAQGVVAIELVRMGYVRCGWQEDI